jgi:hypothetical protein
MDLCLGQPSPHTRFGLATLCSAARITNRDDDRHLDQQTTNNNKTVMLSRTCWPDMCGDESKDRIAVLRGHYAAVRQIRAHREPASA